MQLHEQGLAQMNTGSVAKMPKMTAEEKKWQTESDARAIERYMEVCADEERLKPAYKYLEKKKTEIEAALTAAATNKAMNAFIRNGSTHKA